MDGCGDEVILPNPKNDTDSANHLDFAHVFLNSGMWVAKILHPIRKVWVCVGIYSDHEEATEAYTIKKLQYESHSAQETDASFHTNVVGMKKHQGIMRKPSGKWRARIRHERVEVHLGLYDTPNEAAYAYDLSRLELQSAKCSLLRKAGCSDDLDSKHFRNSSMDRCGDEVILSNPKNDTDFANQLDFAHVFLHSGKWVAKILHPIRKVWVCLGIYSNHEEATEAYTRKKLQYESHSAQETDALFHTNAVNMKKHLGINRNSSGKWRARIGHEMVQVHLGVYDTPNEAAYAYDLSRLELQSTKCSLLRKAACSDDLDYKLVSADAAVHYNCKLESVGLEKDLEIQKDGTAQADKGVCSRGTVFKGKSGKWRDEFEISNVRHLIGTHATAEDAQEAVYRKKYGLGLQPGDALSGKRCVLGLKDNAEKSERKQRQNHAYVSKAGLWRKRIRHPIAKNKRINLGTFDPLKEAEDTYVSIKRQFKLMLESLVTEAKEAYNDKMHEVDLMVRPHKKLKQARNSCKADAVADPFVSVNGIKADRGEAKFVEEAEELDFGVIDSCGKLVGEYSRMDEELWI